MTETVHRSTIPLLMYPPPLPLLITGITGVAGYNAFLAFRRLDPRQVIGIRPPRTWQLRGEGIVALDLEDRAGLETLFHTHRFAGVLHAAGNCALKSCELDPAMAWRLNVAGAANIASLCRRYGCRLVHLSSDLVYSGAGAGGYVESDVVDPVTVYGRTMAEGEAVVRDADPGAAILRISLPMGPSFNRHAGAIDWIDSRFRAGRPATLYFDEVRSCTYTDDLNRVCAFFLANPIAGLFHAGGPRANTLYEIAQVVNRVGDYAPQLLKGCPRRDAGPMPPRAGNVSMNSGKLLALLGHNPFMPWPADETLVPTGRDWHARRAAEQDGGEPFGARLYGYPDSAPQTAAQRVGSYNHEHSRRGARAPRI